MSSHSEEDAFEGAVSLSARAMAARPAPYLDDLNPAQRQAVEALDEGIVADAASAPLEALADPGERGIAVRLALWPQVLASAADAAEPHRVAFYLYDLASVLHAQWNRGKDDETLRFVYAEAPELTRGRLALVEAVRNVLREGLAALGVGAPEEMR